MFAEELRLKMNWEKVLVPSNSMFKECEQEIRNLIARGHYLNRSTVQTNKSAQQGKLIDWK